MTQQQHRGLTAERWRQFPCERQILMIANELHRARKLTGPADGERRLAALERVLALADLTIVVQERRALRRELLRWRDLAAELYADCPLGSDRDDVIFRVLLELSPGAYPQLAALAVPGP